MLAVIFMAAGSNYALFKYVKFSPLEKSKRTHLNSYSQFEKEVKIAKSLRIVGMILFAVLMLSWIDFINLNLPKYFGLFVLTILLLQFFLAINYYRKKLKTKEDHGPS